LLAIVLRVRDLAKGRRLALLDELADAQRRMVEASLRALPSREDLLRRLNLPDPATWPSETRPSTDLLDLVLDQSDDDEPLVPEGERAEAILGRAAGVTYQLATSRPNAAFSGAMLGAFLGIVPMMLGGPMWSVIVSTALGALVMLAFPLFTCADPACGTRLVGHVATCRGCGRPVAGTLRSPEEWLELADHELASEEEDEDVEEHRERSRVGRTRRTSRTNRRR
jgi:uncharacterized MnhB-related membrane protein